MIPRCLLHPNQNVCPTHTDSPDFDRSRACGGYSVIAKLGSLHLFGAQKNDMRCLRDGALGVVRPLGSSGPRSVQRGHAHLSPVRGAARRLPKLRSSEARAAFLPRRQHALHGALCLLRGPALRSRDDPGRGQGAASRLARGQGPGEAVHAGPAGQGGHARSQGDRYRRDLDPQGTHLPHCGERPDSRAPDLVRRRGPLREEHGDVLRLAGRGRPKAFAWR